MLAVLECGALIDAEDLPLVAGLSFRLRSTGHVEYRQNGKTMSLHRLLLGLRDGVGLVDHINGNPLDNRRCNLRLCTHTENMQNRRMHRNNRSGFKGVYLDPRRGTYRAQVRAFNRKVSLGSFATAEQAAAAYVEKAAELHGAFFSGAQGATAMPEPEKRAA